MLELQSRMPRSGGITTTEHAANSGQLTEGYLMAVDAIKAMRDGEGIKTVSHHGNLPEAKAIGGSKL